MPEILQDLQSEQVEIGGVAKDDGQGETRSVFQFDILRHIDRPGDIASHTCFRHERKLFHLILEQFHLIISHGGILNVKAIIDSGMRGAFQHMLHLRLHHESQRDQEYGQRVLRNDEHSAENHPVLAPQRSLDDVDGFIAGCGPGRNQPAERTQHQDAQYVNDHVAGSQEQIQFHFRIHGHSHILRGKERVDRRDQQIRQQQAHGKADGRKGDGLADVFPYDSATVLSQQPARRHFLRPFSAEGETQVDIVEHGGQQQEQHNDSQQIDHLLVARLDPAVMVPIVPEDLIHPPGAPILDLFLAPHGSVVFDDQIVNLGVEFRPVHIGPDPAQRGIVTDAVETLLLVGAVTGFDIEQGVHLWHDVVSEILDDAGDHILFFLYADGLADEIPGRIGGDGQLLRQRLAQDDGILLPESIGSSLPPLVIREQVEKRRVHFQAIAHRSGILLSSELDDRSGRQRQASCRLHLGNGHFNLLLVPIPQTDKFIRAEAIYPRPIGILARHLVLLHHVTPNENHERQAHGQSHRLDDGV